MDGNVRREEKRWKKEIEKKKKKDIFCSEKVRKQMDERMKKKDKIRKREK